MVYNLIQGYNWGFFDKKDFMVWKFYGFWIIAI